MGAESMTKPICVHCGKTYGKRDTHDEQVRFPVGEDMPRYSGNGIIVNISEPRQTVNRALIKSVEQLSGNPEIRAAQMALIARTQEKSEMVATRTIWDGKSWSGGYDPFCTLRCALAYARRAYAARKK